MFQLTQQAIETLLARTFLVLWKNTTSHNYERPPLCPATMAIATSLFFKIGDHGEEGRERLCRLLDTSFLFISSIQSLEQVEKLSTDFGEQECHCSIEDPAVQALHVFEGIRGNASDPQPWYHSVEIFWVAACPLIRSVDWRKVFSKHLSSHHSEVKGWPRQLSSFMPLGPKAFVNAAWVWSQVMQNVPDPFLAVARTFETCSSILEEALRHPQFANAASEVYVAFPDDLQVCIRNNGDLPTLMAKISQMNRYYVRVVSQSPNVREKLFRRDALDQATRRLSALLPELTIERHAVDDLIKDIKDLRNTFSELGNDKQTHRFKRHPTDPVYDIDALYVHFNQNTVCTGPGCLRAVEREGTCQLTPFRVCGGCRLLRFCSRECLKRAWKFPENPHREFCRRFAKFKVLESNLGKLSHKYQDKSPEYIRALDFSQVLDFGPIEGYKIEEMSMHLGKIYEEKDRLKAEIGIQEGDDDGREQKAS